MFDNIRNRITELVLQKAKVDDYGHLRPEEKYSYDLLLERLKKTKPVDIEGWRSFLKDTIAGLVESYDPDWSEKKKEFVASQASLCQKLLLFIERPDKDIKSIAREYGVEE